MLRKNDGAHNLTLAASFFLTFLTLMAVMASPSHTGASASTQNYLLMPAAQLPPANNLSGGKVVFVSNRANATQLFVKQVYPSSPPPQQVTTDEFLGVKHPAWSPNGKYISYIAPDIITGPAGYPDRLTIINEQGVIQGYYHAPGAFGANSLGYPSWSHDGTKIVLTYYTNWSERGLALIEFAAPYAFNTPAVRVLVPPGYGPADLDPSEAVFSSDDSHVYFNADNNQAAGGLYVVHISGGPPSPVFGNGAPITRAYAPSISPDGTRLIYNSELWRDFPNQYQDEELLEVNLLTGVITRLTNEPGNQYGEFAKNSAGEFVMQSDSAPGANPDLFLQENGVRVQLDIADPGNNFKDSAPDWWKPPCGLTGWWPLDETSGTVAADVSGSNNQGARVNQPTPTAGRINGGVMLDGVNDYVEVPTADSLNFGASPGGDFSIAAWVKIAAGTNLGGVRVIVEKRQSSPLIGYSFFLYNGNLSLQLANGNSSYSNYISNVAVPADGNWHHVAVTVDRDNPAGGRWYRDGQVGGGFNPTGRSGSLSNSGPLRLGSLSTSVTSLFKGALDEVAVFNRELQSSEVLSIYNTMYFDGCRR